MPKKFPPEFKRDVVAVARWGEIPVKEVAADFDISESTLWRWMQQADVDDGIKDGLTTAESLPVRLTCGVLGFSTQAFYKWQANPISDREWNDAHFTNVIVDIHRDDPEFGYRFIADELERSGINTCERRVRRLCRDHKVWSTTVKKGRAGSGKRPGPAVHDDLVMRNFNAATPNAIWLTDITEHGTGEGKL